LISFDARADGIDIAWFLTRVGGWQRSPGRAVILVFVLAAVDYALNWIVIGLSAKKMGAPFRRVSSDLVGLTVLGQVADRLGMVLCSFGAIGLTLLLERAHLVKGDLGLLVLVTVLFDFVISGTFVYFLVRYYVCRRWTRTRKAGVIIGLLAAIFTNPAWAVATLAIPVFGSH
jgi:hypothetical protein